MKNMEVKAQFNEEISHLSKNFKALTIDYKKGVLKTAQGLLQIQIEYKEMIAANVELPSFFAQ